MLSDARKLPGVRKIVIDPGLVDSWRVYGWSDFCHPLGNDDFTCEQASMDKVEALDVQVAAYDQATRIMQPSTAPAS